MVLVLDDTIIKTIETTPDEELRESRDLILYIRRRNLYQFCNEYSVPKDQLEHFKDVTAQDISCSQKNGGVLLQEDDIDVSIVRIDLTRGRQNPLESINFFKVLAHLVYPGVVHSRFEHSLGVYWLAGEAIQKLKTYQGLELGIDRFDVLAVKVEQVDIN
ncbi:hypothetical protein GOBAR_DD24093 [Gossypium barbadense]|nr:hypothetical protein GOBAR_DD24093 [Gossypium barbadense]